MVPNAQEYLTLIKTGQMEPLTRVPTSENFLIQAENEEILRGELPVVLRIDEHARHIAEHKTVLSSPSARRDPRIVNPCLQHIADHEAQQQQLQMMDPALLAATHQQPLPFPPAPPPQGPLPGGAPAGPGGPGGVVDPTNPAQQQAAKVKQPNMPNLPKGADPQTQSAYQQIKGA
jgi:hypothetical protein